MKIFLIFLLAWGCNLLAGSIRIINDSMYPLIAEIYSAEGEKIGSITISTHGHVTWQESTEQEPYTRSRTPYTVVFFCQQSGEQYGTINNVNQAATIQATNAKGLKSCKQQKDTTKN